MVGHKRMHSNIKCERNVRSDSVWIQSVSQWS